MPSFTRQFWSRFWRLITGVPLALLGVAIVVAEAYGKLHAHEKPDWMLLVIGLLFTFVGGYLINDTLTKRVADAATAAILRLNPIAGGRRNYDPPADPPADTPEPPAHS